jgi:2-polyprenyl-6-methoxyphenol hydroxylase-like FAD-dependent oxidoreductase
MSFEFDVCVIGAGPVGLTLALDLANRGVRVVLVDRERSPGPWPKMERCNARSMEIYRRLGIAAAIRERGQPSGGSMDVAVVTSLSDSPLAFLKYPTVEQVRQRIADCADGTLPLEPYQVISQYTLEPVLRDAVVHSPQVLTLFGVTAESFEEVEGGVVLRVRGDPSTLRARYLVGCDGGSSIVRKQLGFALEGRGGIGQLRQVFFRSRDLLQRLPIARARHYWIADAHRSAIIVQDDGHHFSLHTALPADADFAAAVRAIAGYDCEVQVLHVGEWTMHLLLAQGYGRGRVFIAGDAAHLVIPTGGLGMNTGVGDATDLAWKLAGAVQGWAGPALLPSYEVERRAVGRRNVDASGFAAAGVAVWRSAVRANICDDTADGAATRAEVARLADVAQRRSHEMSGVELGYSYGTSAIVCGEGEPSQESDFFHYLPSASPGSRLPHAWLSDGRALHDLAGIGYTLFDLGGKADSGSLEAAFAKIGAPLSIVRLQDERAHKVCGRRLVLLRPDLHVAWRADTMPEEADAVARVVTGHGDPHRSSSTASKGLQ